MINRGRQIAQMMGYKNTDELLKAIGKGDLILVKMNAEDRLDVAEWLRDQAPDIQVEDEALSDSLEELASGLEFAMELQRYPADSDICNLDLPYGWPSYCDRTTLS